MHTFAQAVPACAAVSFYALYACVHDKVPRDICLFMAYANNQAQIDVAFEGSSKNGCKGGLHTEQSSQQSPVALTSSASSSQLTFQRAISRQT